MDFKYRILFGLLFFFILGVIDYLKNPKNPTRAKEYLFLFSITASAIVYGIIHDFITYKISPEYFIWGKELESAKNGFNLDVIILAAKALWSVGLIIGVTFLLANNPNKKTKQLRYLILYKYTLYPLFISLVFALAIGICFYVWGNNIIEIPELLNANVEKHFMTTWGIHIGSYLGGLIGLIIATIRIHESRKNALRKA